VKTIAISIAALLLGAPVALAQPANQGGQGYQNDQGQGGYGGQDNAQVTQQYDQSQSDYEARMREYRRERREYERRRAAYDAQFGSDAPAGAYANVPPPPTAPMPPEGWRERRDVYRYSETMPFHEGPWVDRDHGAGWYRDHGCRLAPMRGEDAGNYVPVCPDADGRYHPAA
jgi:hypothetical protein